MPMMKPMFKPMEHTSMKSLVKDRLVMYTIVGMSIPDSGDELIRASRHLTA